MDPFPLLRQRTHKSEPDLQSLKTEELEESEKEASSRRPVAPKVANQES